MEGSEWAGSIQGGLGVEGNSSVYTDWQGRVSVERWGPHWEQDMWWAVPSSARVAMLRGHSPGSPIVWVFFPGVFILLIQSVVFWEGSRVFLSLLSVSVSLGPKVLLCEHSLNLLGEKLYRGAK